MAEPRERFAKFVEEIFWGANVSGKGGFVNLVQIKHEYFKKWFARLINDIEAIPQQDFKEELYDKLADFLRKYFDEAGNIFFAKTRNIDQITEKVYESNKDVSLFWKTQGLYYVKQDIIHYESVKITEDISSVPYTFDFNASEIEDKVANEKKHISYVLDGIGQGTIKFKLEDDSRTMSETKIKKIIKKLKEQNIHLTTQKLQKIFKTYEKQVTVDYFICKNAKKFLIDQLEEYFRNYIFDLKTDFTADRIERLKIFRDTVNEVIKFVAIFEDQLTKVWEKPKFVTDSNFIISFDKIEAKGSKGRAVIKKILASSEFSKQKQEWKDLATCDRWKASYESNGVIDEKYKRLAIDTKHFPDTIKYEILALFDDLDAELDGWLVNSDNFQALNTLKNKFAGKVQCTYIDPPFNSPSSKTVYINQFEEAPWLTLVDNRISAGKPLLDQKNGVFIAAIDKYEQEAFGLLLKKIWSGYDRTSVSIIINAMGQQSDGGFYYTHENAYFVYPEGLKWARNETDDSKDNRLRRKKEDWFDDPEELMIHGKEEGVSKVRDTVNTFYGIKIKDKKIIGYEQVAKTHHPKSNCIKKQDGSFVIYPIHKDAEKRWRMTIETLKERLQKYGEDYIRVDTRKKIVKSNGQSSDGYPFIDAVEKSVSFDAPTSLKTAAPTDEWKTVWTDAKHIAGNWGSKPLRENMRLPLPEGSNIFPKSIWNVYDCLYSVVGTNKEAIVLDYFGGTGTTAHATMLLNKKDNGKRKFILVEQGSYFYTIVLPRIKKAAFATDFENWKDGKSLASDGIGIFVKYYKLEQYEQVLEKSTIYTKEDPPEFSNPEDYSKYIFMDDPQLLGNTLKLDFKKNMYKIDWEKIYPNIDLAETLSCVKGEMIKKQEKEKVSLDGGVIDYKNIEFADVKDLLWWYDL